MHRTLLLTALGISVAGSAVAEPGAARWFPEAREARVARADHQARFDAAGPWQDFTARHGDGWTALWDEATGTPVRFWGEGWPVDSRLDDDDAVWELAREILLTEAPLLGDVSPADLSPWALDRGAGITTVTFRRTWAGLEVQDARISLRFKAGRFVMGQIEAWPGIDLDPQPALDAARGQAAGLAALSWSRRQDLQLESPAELVVLPLPGASSVRYALTWRLTVRATEEPSLRTLWVDAHTGRLLRWDELLRSAHGDLLSEHDARPLYEGLEETPLGGVTLSSPYGEVVVGDDGSFELDGDAPAAISCELDTPHFDLRSAAGDEVFEATLTADGGTATLWTGSGLSSAEREQRRALLTSQWSLHAVRQRALEIDPSFSWASQQVRVRLNLDDATCNAWFDPEDSSLNFVQSGDGCNNTGRVADVIHHEYGHGFHSWTIVPGAGGWGDGSISEAYADYLAATLNDDHRMGLGFFVNYDGPLRDLLNDRTWPEDIQEDIHETGLILAGSLWDLRTLLIEDHGYAAGVAQADHVLWNLMKRAAEIPETYAEALLADDDNGNLDDGTPNLCAIDAAFGAHGLGPLGTSGGARWSLSPAGFDLEPGAPAVLRFQALVTHPQCAQGSLDGLSLAWTTDPDDALSDFTSVALEPAGDDTWEAVLPALGAGSLLRYRVELRDSGVVTSLPSGSLSDPWLERWIGPTTSLVHEDFEDDDGGFEHALLAGDASSEGADDWQWGEPGGQAGDPVEAASGDRVWGNDLSPEDHWNGSYQNDVHSALSSPSWDVGDAERVLLRFSRWLTVEDGFYDQATLVVNGEPIWTNHASSEQVGNEHHEDLAWMDRHYEISHLIGADGLVNVRWDLRSDAGLTLGGWNVDDVELLSIDPWAPAEEDGLSGAGCQEGCSAAPAADGTWAGLLLVPLLRRRR